MTDNPQLNSGNFVWALGLMSGTSLDGIDAALIYTDGERIEKCGDSLTIPYDTAFREQLSLATQRRGDLAAIEHTLTLRHAEAVKLLLAKAGMTPQEIAVIGFHGQTIDHRPAEGISWQLGNGALLAAQTGIAVVNDFRRADVAAGGQGAPLVPLFHAALAQGLPKPLALVNIGGIANITYLGAQEGEILAFDTGTGNGLMNAWIESKTGEPYDAQGALAARGKAHEQTFVQYMQHPFFLKAIPKSLDKHDFQVLLPDSLSLEDGLRTLLEVTVEGIAKAREWLPANPKQWLICGGGAHNRFLMQRLSDVLMAPVLPTDALGWSADMLEAQAFAFLALRSLRCLPLSHPNITGAQYPVTGGALYRV